MSEAIPKISSERLHQTNVIKRFFQSSQPLMLIVGEKDSGKTHLLTNIILQMRASRLVTRLQATPNLQPTQLVSVLSKQWGIRPAEQSHRIENQLDNLLTQLREQAASCILVIDDAHLLSLSVLAVVSHLVTQQDGSRVHLHILLTGRPALVETMNSLQTKEIPHLTVGALSREATFRKIKPLLDKANLYLPHATANAIFNQLYRRSEGMPQTLETMTKKLITQRSSIPDQSRIQKPEMTSLIHFWKAHGIRIFSLASLAVVGYVFWLWQHHDLRFTAKPHHVAQAIVRKKQASTPKPSKFTLQIMSGMNTKAMSAYIQQHHLENKAHIMKTRYNGHDWYTLTYGYYPSREAAKAARATLSTNINARHPWIRSTKNLEEKS